VVLGRAYDQLNQPTKARAVLEGATKLSPENLRAHRILIKIYVAQGLTEEALKSCRVILTMNPRDEETLSVQASLGIQSEPQEPKKTTAVKANTTAREHASEPSVPSPEPTTTPTAEEPPKAILGEPVPQLGEPVAPINEAFATDSPISVATSIMEQALHENDHLSITKQTSIDAQPTGAAAGPSPSAETITQLESWLRSIERQRRDRRISGDYSS
jgi:tetratricopeptide (TPR) repeat protein